MPHISKKELEEGLRNKLFSQLFEIFKTAGRRSMTTSLVIELFTPTEKVMFAKRLSVVLLLHKGIPQHIISEHLHVSPSTVAKISVDLDRGRFRRIVDLPGSKIERIMENMIRFIFYSMPPRVGKGRWKNLNKFFD